MITEHEALRLIRDNIKPRPGERVPLSDALGRASVTDVKAPKDFPPFSCSAFDGYVLRARDTSMANRENPAEMKVAGMAVAGRMPHVSIARGEAMPVMTGAPMPCGADAVVKQEDVHLKGDLLCLCQPVKRGEGVRLKGQAVKKGAVALGEGTIIGPEETGFLASLGVKRVQVYGRPEVALFMIGDELVSPGDALPPGKIHCGNAFMLRSLVLMYGGSPVYMDIVPDSEEMIKSAIRKAARADMVVTSGGSGGGVHDLTTRAFAQAGGQLLFSGVNIWPGGTISFGFIKDTPFFLLPGGPRTSLLCFHLFVGEALKVMSPTERNFPIELTATMLNTLVGRRGVTNYFNVSLRKGRKGYYAKSTRVASLPLSRCALAVLPAEVSAVKKGDKVKVRLV